MRAFRLSPKNSPLNPHQGPSSIEEISLPTNERDTDRPSRFPTGRSIDESIPMSPGENHHRKTESDSRRISFLAQEIERVLVDEGMQPWCLAAPTTINDRILDQIHQETRAFLATNIKSNLTHITLHELEERFVHTPSGP